jgi:GT2 family glycosyltransferase
MALAPAPPRSSVPALRTTPRRVRRPQTTTTPLLSVVIVNYCQWRNTAALVRQLRAAPSSRRGAVEIVIVDNHSPYHPLSGRLRRCPGVSLRRWGRNRGFGRAVNEGCRLSRGDWFLLLNPDMSVTAEFLEGVLALAGQLEQAEPRTGIVGFQLSNTDGSPQPSAGSFPTLPGTLAGLLRPRRSRKYRKLSKRHRCRVSWVTGCCLLVRRQCLEDLGGFDEDFFLYYEDVDLCRRARARGWTVCYEPRLGAVHHHPLHGRPVSPLLRLATRHALLTYAVKHWPRWQARLLSGIVRVEAWLRKTWARWTGDRQGARLFRALGQVAADVANDRPRQARRRLDAVIARQEHRKNAHGWQPVG